MYGRLISAIIQSLWEEVVLSLCMKLELKKKDEFLKFTTIRNSRGLTSICERNFYGIDSESIKFSMN